MTAGKGNCSEGNSVGAGASFARRAFPAKRPVLRAQGEPRTPGLAHEALAACRTVADPAAPKRRGGGRPREDTMSTRKGKSHGVSHIESQKDSARQAAHIVVG